MNVSSDPFYKNILIFINNIIYCKILIISPRAYFWLKGLFTKFLLGEGGIYLGSLYMDKYLCFKNAIF